MKKIVVFDTALYTSNLGDEIIFSSVLENMGYIFDKGSSIRLGTHVKNFSLMQILHPSFKMNYCKNADWKFVCGTNLLSQKMFGKINSQWQIDPLNLPYYKKSILVGVGATSGEETFDAYAKWLFKNVLAEDYIHSVRDEQTKRLVTSLGHKAINTGCPTLWKFTPEFCESIPQNKNLNCVITVSGYKSQRDPVNDRKMIEIVQNNYHECWVFIQTTEDETYFDSLGKGSTFKKLYTLSEFQSVLKNNHVDYIGTRLHGGVFALQYRVRSLVISIDNRAEGFHESNNLPIIQRSEVGEKLETWINNKQVTNILIDQNAINKFLEQF